MVVAGELVHGTDVDAREPRVVLHAQPDRDRPQRRRPGDVEADQHGGDAAEVLHVADRRLQRGDEDQATIGASSLGGRGPAGGGATQPARPWRRRSTRRAVDPGRRGDRQVEAPGVLVAGVRAGAGDDGAGDDRRRGPPTSPTHAAVRGTTAPPARPSGSPARGRGGPPCGHDRLRQQQVGLDGDRVEVDEHGDPAEHDLADDAGDEPERQPREVAPAGLRTAPSTARIRQRDEAGEQPVDLLDGGVAADDVDELLVVAARPVVAPSPEPVRRTAAPVTTLRRGETLGSTSTKPLPPLAG